MADARIDQFWSHTSSLLAMTANAHRDPKKTSPFKPDDFHPQRQKKDRPPPKVGIKALKLFLRK